jgi:hypothetical protein
MELKRLTTAPYKTRAKLKTPDGEEDIEIIYHPLTLKKLRELEEIRLDENQTVEDQAVLLVAELPDLKDNGQAVRIDRALFEAMDLRHINAIIGAVMEDFSGVGSDWTIPTEEAREKDAREQAEHQAG